MKLTLYGNPVTKKNSQQLITVNGRPRILPSKAYRKYEGDCGKQLSSVPPGRIASRVNLKCVYYMETHRRVDLANLLEATQDILTRYGVLADDNSGVVASVDGSRVEYDKGNPRVEIEITEKENENAGDATIGP